MNWLRFFGWLLIGMMILFAFGVRHSTLRKELDAPAQLSSLVKCDVALIVLSGLLSLLLFLFVKFMGYKGGEAVAFHLLTLLCVFFLLVGVRNYSRDRGQLRLARN